MSAIPAKTTLTKKTCLLDNPNKLTTFTSWSSSPKYSTVESEIFEKISESLCRVGLSLEILQ